jgi:hypothetical protein
MSLWQKGRKHHGIYIFRGLEELWRDLERCHLGEVAERSRFDGPGQQYEL